MEGNIYKFDTDYIAGFTAIDNRILDGNTSGLSLEAIGFYACIKHFPEKWNLNYQGLMTVYGISKHKIQTLMNQLIEANYIRRLFINNGNFKSNYYIFNDTNICKKFDEFIQNNKDLSLEDIQQFVTVKNIECMSISEQMEKCISSSNEQGYEFPEAEFPGLQIPEAEFPEAENICPINNNIINNNIKNNILKNNNVINKNTTKTESFCVNNSQQDLNKISKENTPLENTCNSEKNSRIVDLEKIIHKKQENCATGNCSYNPLANMPQQYEKKKTAKDKKQERQQKRNEQQQEQNNSVATKDTAAYGQLMSEVTDEDNVMSNMLQYAKQLRAMGKQLNHINIKKSFRKDQLLKYINRTVPESLQSYVNSYVLMYLDTYGLLSQQSLQIMLQDLQSNTNNNIRVMQECIKEATKKGWRDLYVSEQQQNLVKQDEILKQVQQVTQINNDDYEQALDENGNPLLF